MKKLVKQLISSLLVAFLLTGIVYAASETDVAVVRSDWKTFVKPVPKDTVLSKEEIEVVVRKAIDELGGMSRFVKPEHKWIVIKPNIVEISQRGTGDITDSYVVWALVKTIYEVAPKARITIAEGPAGWLSPGHPDFEKTFGPAVDGFEATGFRDILKDSTLAGARVDIVDLNFDESVELQVPGGGNAREKYFIPKTVLECDVFIDVPVLKVTNSIGFTNAMKNMVGICPGNKYGWPKMTGNPPGSNTGIPHNDVIYDEMIVDLTSLARINLVVVDAIVGMARGRTRGDGGNPMRMNTIIAGTDPVAVDAVSIKMVGMNPDDFEFITLADKRGIGNGDLSKISLKGQPLKEVAVRFEKKPDERARYGQSNRTWLLKGPFPLEKKGVVDPKAKVVAGKDGWSEAVYFGDDKIDMGSYFKKALNCAAYVYTEFTAPKTQEVELWLGSGEGLTVWIDGEEVYSVRGIRQHKLPNDKPKIQLKEGSHSILVRVEQTRGAFDFSLNICEVESDERYSGNRVEGLKFSVPSEKEISQVKASEVAGFRIEEWLSGKVPDWLDKGTWTTYTVENGFPLKRVSSIVFGADSSVWVGGEGGVAHSDGKTWKTWGKKEGFDVYWVNSLALDSKGHIWAMTDKGGFEFDGEKWQSRFGGGSFKGSFVIDNKGRMWTGGYQKGLSLYDGKSVKTYDFKDGLPNVNVMGLAADGSGNVWLATYGGGAIKFDGKSWKTYTAHSSGLGDNHLLCVTLDNDGAPWVGADAGGVSHFEGKRWVAYGKEEGLGDPSASFIAVDKRGNVWVAIGGWDTRERDGISIFDGKNWATGLSNESVICIAIDPEGNVWFGSQSGLTKLSVGKIGGTKPK